jgi:hypothetical protein
LTRNSLLTTENDRDFILTATRSSLSQRFENVMNGAMIAAKNDTEKTPPKRGFDAM